MGVGGRGGGYVQGWFGVGGEMGGVGVSRGGDGDRW